MSIVAASVPRDSKPLKWPFRYPRESFSGDLTEKAYLLGFRAGDLCIYRANYSPTSKTIVVACVTTVQEQLDLMSELFGRYARVTISRTPKQSTITCGLDTSFEFLLPKEDRVPGWILRRDRTFYAYLAGYIDAEGCIQVKRTTRSAELVIRSYDMNILDTCQWKLEQLGIECPPIYVARYAGERDGNGPTYHQDYWCLAVYRRSSLRRLFQRLSPHLRHAKRRRDMERAWQNVIERLSLRPEPTT